MTDRVEWIGKQLDEVVAGRAHLERMGGNRWFLAMGRDDGSEFCVWFDGKITLTEDRAPSLRALAAKEGE